MATAAGTSPLELTVSNFGPIAEASVKLRPMSVLVGPSNTGKSYLATLIYALHRFFGAYPGNASHRRAPSGAFRTRPSDNLVLSESDITRIFDWVNETFVDLVSRPNPMRRFQRELPEPVELPKSIAALTRTAINDVAHLSETLSDEIGRCFGVDQIGSLSSYLDDGSTGFSLRGSTSELAQGKDSWEYKFTVSGQDNELAASVPDAMPLRIIQVRFLGRPSMYRADNRPERRERDAIELLEGLASSVVSDMVGPLSSPAYYLPADRAGVMHAHQVVVRALIASASRAGLRRDAPLPVLSGVLGDFLEQLLDLTDLPYRRRGYHDGLASYLEQGLMRGDISVEREQIDYPSFVYRPHGWQRDLPLMNASSMVSELAPVALYLRHVIQPGDTLIIEEPESHLHPAMQVEFTRLLAAAVKAGIRIIITTHSEWVLEELANLVLMSELPAGHRKEITSAELALSPDEVGAWFFEPNADGSGTVVKEMRLDKELGNFPSGFGLITTELYNRFARISNRIERFKEE